MMVLYLSSCTHAGNFQDPMTLRKLGFLKSEFSWLFDEIKKNNDYLQQSELLLDIKYNLERIYKYEESKKGNRNTLAELDLILRMLEDFKEVFAQKRTLRDAYLDETKKQFEEAIDLVIKMENEKVIK